MRKVNNKSKNDTKTAAERVMGLLAAGIIFMGLLIIILALWLERRTTWMEIVGKILLADFFITVFLLLALSSFKNKNGFCSTLFNVALWNVQLWWVVLQLLLPSMLIIMGLITIVLLPYSLVYFILLVLSNVIELSQQTILFFSLSLGAIITAHYSKPLFKYTSSVLTLHHHQYEKYFPMLVEYVYKPTNMQFVVYFLYVVYLVTSTIYRFQTGGLPIWGNETDIAVLESFLVFIAFSNMKAKYEAAEFKFSQMFRIMFAMWSAHDDIVERKENEE